MVIAGNSLKILDDSAEGTTGLVVLETINIIRAGEMIFLVDYDHVTGKTDDGFSLALSSIFPFYNETDEFSFSEINTSKANVVVGPFTFAAGTYKRWFKVNSVLPGMKLRIAFQWGGAFTDLSTAKISVVGNAPSY